jgi:hypothetical protein
MCSYFSTNGVVFLLDSTISFYLVLFNGTSYTYYNNFIFTTMQGIVLVLYNRMFLSRCSGCSAISAWRYDVISGISVTCWQNV